jgi:hypothetical protein
MHRPEVTGKAADHKPSGRKETHNKDLGGWTRDTRIAASLCIAVECMNSDSCTDRAAYQGTDKAMLPPRALHINGILRAILIWQYRHHAAICQLSVS